MCVFFNMKIYDITHTTVYHNIAQAIGIIDLEVLPDLRPEQNPKHGKEHKETKNHMLTKNRTQNQNKRTEKAKNISRIPNHS